MLGKSVEIQAQHMQERLEKQTRLEALCFEIFENTKEGKELLALWEEQYLHTPVFDVNIPADKAVAFSAIREGQNGFIRTINAYIKKIQRKA